MQLAWPIPRGQQLFEIKNVEPNKAKEKLEPLLTKDKDVASTIETYTLQRSGKTIDYLVVQDTPQNIEKIGLVIEKLEEEFTPILVSIDFTDVELSRALATIVQMTDLNIVGGEGLSQKVSVHLKDVPLDDVIGILLKSSEYTYIKEDDVLRIIPEEEAPIRGG